MEIGSFVFILHKKYAHYYINLYLQLLWWDHTSHHHDFHYQDVGANEFQTGELLKKHDF